MEIPQVVDHFTSSSTAAHLRGGIFWNNLLSSAARSHGSDRRPPRCSRARAYPNLKHTPSWNTDHQIGERNLIYGSHMEMRPWPSVNAHTVICPQILACEAAACTLQCAPNEMIRGSETFSINNIKLFVSWPMV